VRQLARPQDVRVERLLALILSIATMRVEQMLSPVGQRHSSFAAVEGHATDQSLVAQVTEAFVARITKIALRYDPKRPCRTERPAVLQVQFVEVIAVEDQLTFETARQFQISEEHVARVVLAITSVAIAVTWIVVALSRIVVKWVFRRTPADSDPMNVDVAGIVIALSGISPSGIATAIHRAPLSAVQQASTVLLGAPAVCAGGIRRAERWIFDRASARIMSDVRTPVAGARTLVHVRRRGEVDDDSQRLIAQIGCVRN